MPSPLARVRVTPSAAAGCAVAAALLAMVLTPGARAGPRPEAPQGLLSALQTDMDQIARRARPSVVTVFAQTLLTRETAHPSGSPPGNAPEAGPGAGAATVPAPVRMHTRVGSGVAVEESEILTTASVVLGADRLMIRTANGLQVEAELAGMDPLFNIALLRVPEVRLPPLRFADGAAPQVGDWVIALGTSFRAQPTQSVGNIAFIYREPRVPLLQLTNLVYPGNSGGAALSPSGELVGIVQGELGAPDFEIRGPESEQRPTGMSLVLPAHAIRAAYEGLRREGRVRYGYLGVTTRAASVASEADADVRVPLGALVEAVIAGSPAARLGLRRGDLVVGFDGERVEYPEQLARWVAATRPGITVSLVWARSEIQQSSRVVLAESPAALPGWAIGFGIQGGADASSMRISQIEEQIRRLNRQLDRLKGQTTGEPR